MVSSKPGSDTHLTKITARRSQPSDQEANANSKAKNPKPQKIPCGGAHPPYIHITCQHHLSAEVAVLDDTTRGPGGRPGGHHPILGLRVVSFNMRCRTVYGSGRTAEPSATTREICTQNFHGNEKHHSIPSPAEPSFWSGPRLGDFLGPEDEVAVKSGSEYGHTAGSDYPH